MQKLAYVMNENWIWWLPVGLVNLAVFALARYLAASVRWFTWVHGCFAVWIFAMLSYPPLNLYQSGCLFAPKYVAYHDGMTLCPGQSMTISIPVLIKPLGHDI